MKNNNNVKSFSDVLQQGLGRAFDYIKRHDKLEIREDLLNACLHDLRYDSQCEPSRAEWLFELICLTGDDEFYRAKIFYALPKTDEFWDLDQLYELVFIWAKQGDLEAKNIIYSTFEQQELNESWLGGKQIIALDGIKGLLFVAEIVGARLLKDNELWEDDNLITQASEIHSKDKVYSALEQKALNNARVRAYLDAVKSHQENLTNIKSRQNNIKKAVDIDTIIQKIEGERNSFYLLRRFGLYASEDDIRQIFEKLLLETRDTQLIRYLWIFKYRPFPRLDNRLFDLAASNNELIQSATIQALANNQDDSLRDLAIKLIQQQPKSIDNRVLKLFIENYKLGDFQIIESVLKLSQNIDTKHYIGMDLIEILDTYKSTKLTPSSFWVYENTPCAYCRHKSLEILINLQQINPTIIEECSHDCFPEIRELVNAIT